MSNVSAAYEVSGFRYEVDDDLCLLMNDETQYVFSIDSQTEVRSLAISFPDRWVAEARAAFDRTESELLENTFEESPPEFP